MLAGDGEAGGGVHPYAEAQQGTSYCYAAVNQANIHSPSASTVLFSFSQEEEEKERQQEEKVGGTPCPYLIFVTGTTGGARVKKFCPV